MPKRTRKEAVHKAAKLEFSGVSYRGALCKRSGTFMKISSQIKEVTCKNCNRLMGVNQ